MSADLCLSVADITTGIVSHERLDLRVAGAARAFLVSCGTPDITIQVATGDLSRPPGGGKTGEKIFDSGALWQLYRDGGDLLFRFRSPVFGSVPYKTARFSPDFRRGEVSLHRPYSTTRGPVYPLEYPLDELMLTNFLAQGRGVEIHGCGVIDHTPAAPVGVRGYLFAGPSGAGKTTMARLWKNDPGVTILSDDRVVLRPVGRQIWMYGTPWHGDEPLASPACVPLTGVFFLQHALSPRLAPVEGALAAARLFACGFVPFYSGAALDFTLEVLEKVTRAVPCHDFEFAPDSAAIEFIRRQAA